MFLCKAIIIIID